MTRRPQPPPRAPAERGEEAGRPYLLWLPDRDPPWPAMVILHGAGSRKENHADFARLCADGGWAALAYDQRGHGEASDELSPQIVDDVGRIARMLAAREEIDRRRICVRGSSMGGFVAIHATAVTPAIAGTIAICPAWEDDLRRGLRERDLEARVSDRGRGELDAWLSEHDIREAVALIGARPLIILHARGDERIAVERSEELHRRAEAPKKLIVLPGGHHRSVQHDAELQGVALAWLERELGMLSG